MKKSFLIFCFVIVLVATAVYAATEQWSIDGQCLIFQVVADGKGGCALTCSETNGAESVIWVNKKGGIIYQTIVSNVTIIACSNKQLVYNDDLSDSKIVQVDVKKGTTVIEQANKKLYGSLLLNVTYASEMYDKKGFFAVKIDASTGRQQLVRFSNK